jgi:hypothetical protein
MRQNREREIMGIQAASMREIDETIAFLGDALYFSHGTRRYKQILIKLEQAVTKADNQPKVVRYH